METLGIKNKSPAFNQVNKSNEFRNVKEIKIGLRF